MLTQAKREFIEFMMSADVLRFGNFVTKSGRNTPYFVNTGNYKHRLAGLPTLGKFYARLHPRDPGRPGSTPCSARPTRAFPLAAVTAARPVPASTVLDKPYFFNRKEAKDHGEGGSLGRLQACRTATASSS